MKKLLAALLVALSTGSANAQSVVQSGSVTPGHVARWISSGIVGDGGSAASPVITSLGTVGSGPTICAQSAATSTGNYNRLCLGATNSRATIEIDNIGTATGGLVFSVNGVTQGLPTINLPATAGDAVCFLNNGGVLTDCGSAAVLTVFGRTGHVVSQTGDYAVGQVTGAAPLNSPALTGVPTAPTPGSNISTTQIPTTAWVGNWFAPLASPPLTGTPTAPTATPTTNTTQLATTAFAQSAKSAFVSTATNSGNHLTISPFPAITALANGQVFNFISPVTTDSSGFIDVVVTGVASGPFNLFNADGESWAFSNDLQKGQATSIQWSSGQGAFITISPPAVNGGFSSISPHNSFSLAAGSATAITLNGGIGAPGGTVLQWNSTNGGYRMARLQPAGGLTQELFNATATINGINAQTAADNTLYQVYELPQSTGYNYVSPTLPLMNFVTFVNGGGPHPCTTADNVSVYCNSVGTQDPTQVFLGLVYTNTHNIANNIAPADAKMGSSVYSFPSLGRETFGYQTLPHTNNSFSNVLTTQTLPYVQGLTTGLTESPIFRAHTDVTCTADSEFTVQLQIGGLGYVSGAGGSFTVTSRARTVSVPANKNVAVDNDWESAPAMGWLHAQLNMAAVTVGSCTAVSDILGTIAQ